MDLSIPITTTIDLTLFARWPPRSEIRTPGRFAGRNTRYPRAKTIRSESSQRTPLARGLDWILERKELAELSDVEHAENDSARTTQYDLSASRLGNVRDLDQDADP